ncbi:ISWI one complex protein 2 [Wickerhamomyces ciferrii]|uniref:ISWI one complex protein 2 n=1 Tax=Wickerhamomyces ciferrii (strain ATCC 14091 / BCRC 22168 / CBS 111 / JCM 3599 / NBRC 0793 / NRRL Y-1031 F-60-10) TaxID=1206466 RepID=K0L017_WICCF|nr:ISWI one complex protein 2 [Wickerhamomyces ciferrii]CCH46733.1 ISWI one complex protein 2 [Wickerhamomyces ciferrii]
MSRSSKTATPVSDNHPANKLTFIDEEIKIQLQKTPFQLVIEAANYQQQLKEVRNDWKYAFVLQWLYLFRGAIRLSGEPFNVDLIEEELVGLSEPSLLNKIATNLLSVTLGAKVNNIEDFGYKTMYLLGEKTNLLGNEDHPIDFESLSLLNKFEIFYLLIFEIQYSDNFRKQVEKYEKENELRIEPIFEINDESFFLLSDNRIYSRILNGYPKLNIPRKFKNAKLIQDPEVEFPEIEPNFQWKLIANGIYEIHDFLKSIEKDKKYKPLFLNIKEYINIIAQDDLNRRRKVLKRKREQQLTELVSNRKRSSRLQEREEQLKLEKEQREAQEARDREEQAKIKLAKKVKSKENSIKREFEEKLRNLSSSRRTTVFGDSNYQVGPKPADMELGEGEWLFECYCGVRELNYDDGGKLISCERCFRWQHLKCQDRLIQQELIKNSNEFLICNWCKQDLEKQVELKLEQEQLQRQKEFEEKQRLKELQKQKDEELKLQLIEEERKRKEEYELERERRTQERERLRAYGITSQTQSPDPIDHQTQAQPQTSIVQSHSNNGEFKNHSNLPIMGSFHTIPKPSAPQVSQAPVVEQASHVEQNTNPSQVQLQPQPTQQQNGNSISNEQPVSTENQKPEQSINPTPEHSEAKPQQPQQPQVEQPQQTQQAEQQHQPGSITTPIPATKTLSPQNPENQTTSTSEKITESPSRSFSIQNILQ